MFDQAWAFVEALTGDASVGIVNWRAIHDTDKTVPAIPFRGTIDECWHSIQHYNSLGYGIFATISAMDGQGLELANVQYIRAHFVDLDNLSAEQNYGRATQFNPPPNFAVQTSPGKYHIYWVVEPYVNNDHFQLTQRKLIQSFDGDKSINDATRVMRVPGTYHLKGEPFLVNCWALAGFGQRPNIATLDQALASVNVIDGASGVRHPLGDSDLAAPSVEWIIRALDLLDPNTLDRAEWIAITSAIKQAGWSICDPEKLFTIWSEWCSKYHANDIGENLKQWNSIRNTELGWSSLLRRIPALQAVVSFGQNARSFDNAPPIPAPAPPALDCSGEYLTHLEQQKWFGDCHYIISDGAMFSADKCRFLSTSQFNAVYGGKKFIVDSMGKMVNEPWQAATRSTLWTVPKVDHKRFIPDQPYCTIIHDELGRAGINVYKPIIPKRAKGDPSPFLYHLARLLPDPGDQKIILDYLAHNVKYPGHKIPWAPVIQSVQGAGKGILKKILTSSMGRPYTYFPNAKELTNSGSQFNAWMRNKLFILADEIKVDDRRDLIEVLKPMISEEIIEIQGKGNDQELEDNFSNWLFFTNWKDAIPITQNDRRFSIFYSPLQTRSDLLNGQMGEYYFKAMYDWLNADGAAIVTDYLLDYPIARGALPMRAPDTSSAAEVFRMSRSPLERVIWEAVEEGLPGFKGGWVSSTAAATRAKALGAVRGSVSPQAIAAVVESMGYRPSGRALRPYFQEDREVRAQLFHYGHMGDPAEYGRAQGYE